MNSKQAKQIRIEDYLQHIGIVPAKERGYNLWYLSPFRNENKPSFKVNRHINQWHDFGSGDKGNIIDLSMKLNQTTNISEALLAIEQTIIHSQSHSFSFRQQEFSNSITEIEVKPIRHPALIELLRKRKIPIEIASQYSKEIHYNLNGNTYFAIAFPNNKGGYETLNPYFKGCIPPKEITIFNHKTTTVHLFEGFMDYLSLLVMQVGQSQTSAIILNSITNLEKAIPFLSKHSRINAFLDNDVAGKQALEKLQKMNLPIANISIKYAEYKDMNDYLCGKKMVEKRMEKTTIHKGSIGKRFKR